MKRRSFITVHFKKKSKPEACVEEKETPSIGKRISQTEAKLERPRWGLDGRDSFERYVGDIEGIPLLNQQEETLVARRIKDGDEEARELMIKSNLRLVIKIARDYEGLGVPLIDLINEGNIGLMRAVDKFDLNKGAKFSTYAAWWIKQSVKRCLGNEGKTIRVPIHLIDQISKVRKVSISLYSKFKREPTYSEIAKEMGITRERVTFLIETSQRPASLDALLGEDGDSDLANMIPDTRAQLASDQLSHGQMIDIAIELFNSILSDREKAIIELRFGLNNQKEHTLEEVGKIFGVTRERIRQIQDATLEKLRKCLGRIDEVKDPRFENFLSERSS